MEAALRNKSISNLSLTEVTTAFFKEHNPDSARVLFWKFFQCWTTKECKTKAEVSDEEVALFFDQLIDLVAAAYILHQANRVPENGQEGTAHE